MDNYEKIKQQVRRYSFEKLKNSKQPLQYLEELQDKNSTMIENAVKPEQCCRVILNLMKKLVKYLVFLIKKIWINE